MKPKTKITPEGWTEEMVDLVWQNFYHKMGLYGGPYFPATEVESQKDLGNGYFEWTYKSIIHKLPKIPGTKWSSQTSVDVALSWDSIQIRLKTWAMVGCPIDPDLIENAYPKEKVVSFPLHGGCQPECCP